MTLCQKIRKIAVGSVLVAELLTGFGCDKSAPPSPTWQQVLSAASSTNEKGTPIIIEIQRRTDYSKIGYHNQDEVIFVIKTETFDKHGGKYKTHLVEKFKGYKGPRAYVYDYISGNGKKDFLYLIHTNEDKDKKFFGEEREKDFVVMLKQGRGRNKFSEPKLIKRFDCEPLHWWMNNNMDMEYLIHSGKDEDNDLQYDYLHWRMPNNKDGTFGEPILIKRYGRKEHFDPKEKNK